MERQLLAGNNTREQLMASRILPQGLLPVRVAEPVRPGLDLDERELRRHGLQLGIVFVAEYGYAGKVGAHLPLSALQK